MRVGTLLIALAILCIAVIANATLEVVPEPARVLVIDGSPVHNVGQLQLHMSNWGMFGSWPGSGLPFQEAPSAEWPAGSGIEYLYGGGLWVGALKSGVPAVSTAMFKFEFRPTEDPLDIVYYSSEGSTGGNRLPSSAADDDGDGAIDEDPLDGHDNDGDGLVDEDYAAISDQMLARWYTDNQPELTEIYPDHNPLDLMVREHSYQWSHPDYDDFVGVDYEITNIGDVDLEHVYIGVFIDPDVGMRNVTNYWTDDGTAFASVPGSGGGSYDFAYGFDADGDGGAANGNFGVVILDHLTDPTGEDAPATVGATTFANFSGSQPYEQGGDPTNDFERYELMSSRTIERDSSIPRDYRVLISTGPFASLARGETIAFTVALVATPRDGNFENVVNAATLYEGEYFDVDGDPGTGEDGKEYQVHWWIPGQTPPSEPVMAEMRCTPPILNLHSNSAQLLAHITLPEGYDCADVDPSSLMLNGTVAGSMVTTGNDHRFIARFSRKALMQLAGSGEMDARVTWMAAEQPFMAVDDIRIIGGSGPRMAATSGVLEASNSPNPFNPTTRIAFVLAGAADVTLEVYSADGKRVRRLASGHYPAGDHGVVWNGTDDAGQAVASGIYFYRLRAGRDVLTKKMVLIK
jgi:hypothetical protein